MPPFTFRPSSCSRLVVLSARPRALPRLPGIQLHPSNEVRASHTLAVPLYTDPPSKDPTMQGFSMEAHYLLKLLCRLPDYHFHVGVCSLRLGFAVCGV